MTGVRIMADGRGERTRVYIETPNGDEIEISDSVLGISIGQITPGDLVTADLTMFVRNSAFIALLRELELQDVCDLAGHQFKLGQETCALCGAPFEEAA